MDARELLNVPRNVPSASNHQLILMEALWSQKSSGKFCDVVIKVLEHCVTIHSCVLAAFSNLLNEKLVDVIQIDISDDDVDDKQSYIDALDRIVDFIYKGEINYEEKNVRQIKKIADILQIEQVAKECTIFLSRGEKKLCKNANKNRKTVRKLRRSTSLLRTSRPETAGAKYYCPHLQKPSLGIHRKRYTCSTCGFFAFKVKPLLTHLREKRHDGTLCSLCNFQATSNDELFEHLQRHDQEKPFFCITCDARFRTRTALNLHLPKHSNHKPHVCTECGKGFKWKHALQSHVILHTDSKQHLCDQCGYRTAHQSSFKAHCLLHTGKTFKCAHVGCNFEAVRKQNLTQHMKTHSKEKPFQCEVCGHAFSLVKNLRRHARIHNANENLIRCPNCEFSTTRVDKLKEHNRKHHKSDGENTRLDSDSLNINSSFVVKDSSGQFVVEDSSGQFVVLL